MRHTDQVEEGLRPLGEVLAGLEASGQGYWLAEAHRLQGELLQRQPLSHTVQAEACFQQALAIARHPQARSLALLATMRLARLWRRQGRRTET